MDVLSNKLQLENQQLLEKNQFLESQKAQLKQTFDKNYNSLMS